MILCFLQGLIKHVCQRKMSRRPFAYSWVHIVKKENSSDYGLVALHLQNRDLPYQEFNEDIFKDIQKYMSNYVKRQGVTHYRSRGHHFAHGIHGVFKTDAHGSSVGMHKHNLNLPTVDVHLQKGERSCLMLAIM